MKISINTLNNKERKDQKANDIEWDNKIKDRDGWVCVICGNKYAPNAHHIIPRENKDYRYCFWNGISICRNHHKFSRKISAHNNPLAFFLWLQKYRPLTYQIVVETTKRLVEEISL